MIKKTLFFLIFISTLYTVVQCNTVFIIIPGTWAYQGTWYKPGGNFFEALSHSAQTLDMEVVTYYWSFKNSYADRLEAATNLVLFLQRYSKETNIILVSHSHGSNVAIIASKLLGNYVQKKHIYGSMPHGCCVIKAIYALGTPVDPDAYMPDMYVVKSFYHFFSFSDFIQPVFGMFERIFPEHPRIANIAITIDNREPNHTELHAPCIGTWLPYIHKKLAKQGIGNFESFAFPVPAYIHFYTDKHPEYCIDHLRSALLVTDQKLIQKFTTTLST